MRIPILLYLCLFTALAACGADEERTNTDFGFDGTCASCHNGLSAGHVHGNYKLRCVDCHGGNDQVNVPAEAFKTEAVFRDQSLLRQAHVLPKPGLARFFFGNGVDDDDDGMIDEPAVFNAGKTQVLDFGEVFEPGLHGQGGGEFIDTELQRDLNYTRFLNPGDLRVASISCGGKSRAALEGGGGGGCHQQTIDIVRRSVMVNQSAVINGAYYGNESQRASWRAAQGNVADPRFGAFGYTLDYEGVDQCIDATAAQDDAPGGRVQPRFDSACLERRATAQDATVAANGPGNAGLPAFEMAQGTLKPVTGVLPNMTIEQTGAGDQRLPWGGKPSTGDAHSELDPVPCAGLQGPDCNVVAGVPDPVDNILRTFRAYYPLNYPGSTNNFNFTFGTSIRPEIDRFKTANPYGRGHSSGCSACHVAYSYEGSRAPTQVRQDDGTVTPVIDPTTKHREFNRTQDRAAVQGVERLVGRVVSAQERIDTGREQQRTYSEGHNLTAKVTTKTCGLCHGFVTRINYAYQGMAEEEQRDSLARRKAIEFTTPNGTAVSIRDSWVREDAGPPLRIVDGDCPQRPCGSGTALGVIELARKRDSELAAMGLVPGAGGCAAEVFTEDCNNNGELDATLVLERRDEDGDVVARTTINEDLNGNGKLDLIDRVPREESIDGRQVRYVYGGRNGSTRQMDIHFQRGMHCIDCHFLQDVHGDGHLYSTNWDGIEIECEDCHGAVERATLVTSGPNGGNDLRRGKNHDLQPFFEDKGGSIIQRSRVTPGVFWKVPQTPEARSAYAREAHDPRHIAAPKAGSTFAGQQGSSELTSAKLECAACHGSWIHNCMGCHVELNLGDKQRALVDTAGAITASAGENEVWLSNFNNPGHVNFQLLGLLKSPFVLGVSSTTEQGRLGPFRSSMQVHLTVSDTNGHTTHDNLTFTTYQAKDANTGRANVATSGVAMNQTMPHTVRPAEARGCESCHPLVDAQTRVRNEHVLAQTYGLGTGAYPYAGDWAIAAGTGGIELFEHKQERELAANKTLTASTRFPGMIMEQGNPRTDAKVEPLFDGTAGNLGATAVTTDVALIRNFQPPPAGGTLPGPTLRDLAVMAVDAGGQGRLVITDLTGRGHPAAARQSVSSTAKTLILTLPAPPRGLAHLSPDTSDPYVYVAVGASGVSVVRIADAPRMNATTATVVRTVLLQGNRTAQDVILAGDLLYVGTQQGTIDVLSLSDPENPTVLGSVALGAAAAVNRLALAGFVLYAATQAGLASVALDNPSTPTVISPPIGPVATGLAVREGRAYLAAGASGVVEIDVRTPSAPGMPVSVSPQVGNARDVVVSVMPGQTWLQVLEATGDVAYVKLDNKKSLRERCFPDPGAAQCLLDLQFMDPTQMSRDPSFDPVTGMFDAAAVDPSGPPFFRQTRAIITTGTRLARPAVWDQLGTLTGRRMRDSFMPGSGVLSLPVMQKMRGVVVCELNQPSNHPAGLGAFGFFDGAGCQPFGTKAAAAAARRASACRPASFGSLEQVCGPTAVAPSPASRVAGAAGSRPR
jgi:LVIVD repeat